MSEIEREYTKITDQRLLIAGTGSGCGKTTVTCAILSALRQSEKFAIRSYKCGPDYIDTMLHRAALGGSIEGFGATETHKSYNIDSFFLEGDALASHLARGKCDNGANVASIAVLEGAMGHYDGTSLTFEASSHDISIKTSTPVILVVNASGMAGSAGAVIHGFVKYAENNNVKGVIFNNIDENRYLDIKVLAERNGVKPCGYFPRNIRFAFGSRHLGLNMPHEIEEFREKILEMGIVAGKTIDISALLEIAKSAEALETKEIDARVHPRGRRLRLAVAKDEAFCFIYMENIESVREMGCDVVFFSPLHDEELPPNIDGLYLCGGYPELHAEKLEKNESMLRQIKNNVLKGLPTIAEGGGFIYLHESITLKSAKTYKMAGVIRGNAYETERLQRFGYATLTAKEDCAICRKSDTIRAREFHYFDSDNLGNGFEAFRNGRGAHMCAHTSESMYAGFPQLYFPSDINILKNFIRRMQKYAQ